MQRLVSDEQGAEAEIKVKFHCYTFVSVSISVVYLLNLDRFSCLHK